MTFHDYEIEAAKTAQYPEPVLEDCGVGLPWVYPMMGLSGEVGELSEKLKKVLRDDAGVIKPAVQQELMKEAGDILWYLTRLANELQLSMEEVAMQNVLKLRSRMERGVIGGSGDNR